MWELALLWLFLLTLSVDLVNMRSNHFKCMLELFRKSLTGTVIRHGSLIGCIPFVQIRTLLDVCTVLVAGEV